ncbi:hypothetical protein NP233_g5003 [Leucocoprinus birnbaumii]|uniref:SMP domain-containing protein n=1 Tax=Leucocoprinus birnbaumii TaxID=56174 RepID=A0AAD5YSA4_9AGAR|nr:hypothetical protein NP233_g5003 [Leucocoprinus birnbaumii]
MSGSKLNQINLDEVSEAEARKLMSEEHKNLGYRPPPGSLASEAQSVASKHETGFLAKHDTSTLEGAVREDAARISRERAGLEREGLSVQNLSEDQVRQLMSEEHKELGYRPPPGSLASEAQSEVRKKQRDIDHEAIHEAAVRDARRIQKERGESI